MAKHTLADRGHSSPFSCQDCSIFFLACGKVFWRAEVFLLVCYWGATGQPISALRTSMAPSWVSWGSWVSWPRRWSSEAARCLPRPPTSCHSFPAASSGRAARKAFHFPAGGPRHPGHPGHPRQGRCLVRSAAHAPVNRRREALSMHRPGCLGCPGCPGQGAGPAKRPSAYLGHRQVAIHFQPLPVGGPPARNFRSTKH